ncbi:GAF domain-containing protein [Haloarcula hispanica]|nr:GAF domain-containing protein [Haloarcula hispanica]
MGVLSNRIRILHVDDEPGFAEMASEFLEREDDRFAVETETSVSEGHTRLAESDFDCIISDHDMPDQNGIEFLESVREEYPDLPFILYTGKGSEEIASSAISAGATDYLQKQSGTSQYTVLSNRIRNAVEQYRVNRERRRRRERQKRQGDAPLELTTDKTTIAGDFETALERITETAADVLDVPRINVWLFDDDHDTLQCVDHFDKPSGIHESTMELDVENYPAYVEALESNRSIVAHNAIEDPRTAELRDYLEKHDVQALLDSTIRSEGTVVGVVCHEHVGGPREWTDDETEFANDIADLVQQVLRTRERIKRTSELERARDLLRHTEGIADVGSWEVDPETQDVYWSDHLFEMLGWEDEEEPPLEDALDVYVEEDRPRVQSAVEEALGAGESFAVEARFRRSDGEIRWFDIRGEPVIEDGKVVTVRGAVHDVTDRRRREHVLREMYDIISNRHSSFEDQVQALLELGRAELDVEYGTLSEIRGEEYVFKFVDADSESIQPNDVVPVSATNCEIVASTEQTLVLENVERDAPGETDRAGFTEWGISCYIGSPIFVEDEVYGTFCFYDTDSRASRFSEWEETLVDLMSNWVSHELQRQQVNERLQAQNEQLEQFASIVSHDLRNPLNVAQGRLELAREECDSGHLDGVMRAHSRMTELIEDLLTLAREGDAVRELESVDVASLTETCWKNVATAEATLTTEITRRIQADRSRLQQLLENLLRNAIEHGGENVTITIGELEDGFYVEDDGPGIPEDERDDVFEPAYSTAEDGTGFGLSIVKQIAQAHGWDIQATDSSEGGARFEITNVESAAE